MPVTGRRVILKPPQLDARTVAQLERALSAAVEAQTALAARSAHILQFTGPLQQDDSSFFVSHEPAKPLIEPAALFDPAQPGSDAQTLLRWTAALFDALKATHTAPVATVRCHGGICSGVLLVSTDGIEKISDFGFAQAICAVLGPERYLNLAVAVPADAGQSGITAVWESLSADEYERQDRLCGFVDPEKYRTQAMTGFEPGSDVIAAGFLLHLLAERSHPYLPDPDAHRMVEMSQFMAMSRYNGARRPDLRGSSAPAVKLWCDLVAQMLGLPQERPTAAAVSEALSVHVRPASAADLLARQFQARLERVRSSPPEAVDWRAERAAVAEMAGHPDLDVEVSAAAKKLLGECDARLALADLHTALEAEQLTEARAISERVLALSQLPPDVQQQVRDADAVIRHNADALREIAHLSQIRGELDSDPEAALAQIAALRNGVDALTTRGRLLYGVQSKLTVLQEAVVRDEIRAKERIQEKIRQEKERAEAERKQREQDRTAADQWVQSLESALKTEQWEQIPPLLGKRPDLRFFPQESDRRAAEIQRRYDTHVAEVNRQQAIRADHDQAQAWIAAARKAVDEERWDDAEKRLAAKPNLTHWPPDMRDEETALAKRVADQRRTERERAEAMAWFERLQTAVRAERWSEAGDVLTARARLARVPEDIAVRLPDLEKSVREHLATIELEARRRREEQRQAEEWLKKAADLAEKEQWDPAIAHLSTPPQLQFFPDAVRTQAEALLGRVRAGREIAHRKQQEQRRAAATEAMQAFVLETASSLDELISPQILQARVTEVTFEDDDALATGEVRAEVAVKLETSPLPKSEHRFAVPFTSGDRGARIQDEKNIIRDALHNHLRAVIAARQQQELSRWTTAQRTGFLAAATWDLPGADVLPRREVTCALRIGDGSAKAEAPARLTWRASNLSWELINAAEVVQLIVAANAAHAAAAVRPALLKSSTELKRYESLLDVTVTPGTVADLGALQKGAPLRVTIALRIPGRSEPVALPPWTAISPTFGSVASPDDRAFLEAALRQRVVEVQQASWQGLCEAVLADAEKAGIKRHVKLTAQPSRITEPVSSATLVLRLLKRPPVTLEAAWDAATFAFQRKGDWNAACKTILVPLAPGEGRRGLAVPAGVAAVVVVAAALTVWTMNGPSGQADQVSTSTEPERITSREENRSNQTASNDSPTQEETTPIQPPSPPPSNETVPRTCATASLENDLRSMLEASPVLASAVKEGWLPVRAVAEGDKIILTCDVPGLGVRVPPLEVRPDDAGVCAISAADQARIAEAVRVLDDLFALKNVQSQLESLTDRAAGQALAPFLRARPRVTMAPPPEWTLDGSSWTGVARMRMDSVDARAQVIVAHGEHDVAVRVSDGKDVLTQEQEVASLTARVMTDGVRKLQEPSITALLQSLTDQLRAADSGANCSVVLADGSDASGPVAKLDLLVQCPNRPGFPQSLAALWDSDRLVFNPPDLNPILAGLTPKGPTPAAVEDYAQWLDALNAVLRTPQRPPWLAVLPEVTLTQVAAPANGVWKLALTAPWAGEDAADPADDLLPLELIDDRLNEKQQAGDVAQRMLRGALAAPPAYWPIVEVYLQLKAEKQEIIDQVDRILVPRALELWKAPNDQFPLQFALDPRVEGPVKVNYDAAGQPASLTLPVSGYWFFIQPEWEQKYVRVLNALNEPLAAITAQWTVQVSRDGLVNQAGWTGGERVKAGLDESRGKVDWIVRLLRRAEVEAQLAAAVGRPLDPAAALALLRAIWEAKQIIGIQETASLEKLSSDLWEAVRPAGTGPTAFIEYYCGVNHCYALTWSAAPPPAARLVDGPVVVRVGALAKLRADAPGESARALLDAALEALPRAVAAGEEFRDCFSVSVALDRTVLRLTETELLEAPLSRRETTLKIGEAARSVPWSRLSEFTAQRERGACQRFAVAQYDTLKSPARRLTGFAELIGPNNVDRDWAIDQMSSHP